MRKQFFGRSRTLRLCCVFCCCLAGLSQATPLNLVPATPDFMTSGLGVSYNFGTSTFQATGSTTDYEGGSVSLLGAGNYSLTATINHSGVLTGGTLSIQGNIGTGVETLLTGSLNTGASGTAFGFQDPSATPPRNLFEFLFTVTGGDPAVVNDFGHLGAPNRGVIINAFFENGGTAFNGTWTSSFGNVPLGVSDNFVLVPEPACAALLSLAGVFGAVATRRSGFNRAPVRSA